MVSNEILLWKHALLAFFHLISCSMNFTHIHTRDVKIKKDLNTLQVWIHMFVNNEQKVRVDDFENLTIGTL